MVSFLLAQATNSSHSPLVIPFLAEPARISLSRHHASQYFGCASRGLTPGSPYCCIILYWPNACTSLNEIISHIEILPSPCTPLKTVHKSRAFVTMRYDESMKIYSWNVNGIRAVEKKGLLEPFLQKHQPDILCLQETKAQDGQVVDEFAEKYPAYEQFWHAAERKGYSGTAIFTKTPPEEVHFGLPQDVKHKYELDDTYGDTTKEGRVLTLEFEHIYVSTVYTPNAKDDLSRLSMREHWDPAYLAYMKQLAAEKPVVFCGDFNVAHTELDLARPKPNEGKKGFTIEERSGFNAMVEAGFVDTFRLFTKEGGHYTWWSHFGGARERNVGWRIDYVMVSQSLVPLVQSARIHPQVIGSDHCPVSIDINI